NCSELRALDIAGNKIKEIDLSPLVNCTSLEEIYLYSDHPEENDFSEIDVSALFSCIELEDIGISDDTEIVAAKALKKKDIPLALEELVDDGRITWI
ncbi:MAG: hypothetical protein ACXAB6_04920, partial [Candidatus Thorarchaeota archaeon]